MAAEEMRKCWACGGVMTLKKDDKGPFFQCSNDFCQATLTELQGMASSPMAKSVTPKKEKSGRK
jgi:ssDNA-binding Zn-finger/Zn-ribbon topoisomerase 1